MLQDLKSKLKKLEFSKHIRSQGFDSLPGYWIATLNKPSVGTLYLVRDPETSVLRFAGRHHLGVNNDENLCYLSNKEIEKIDTQFRAFKKQQTRNAGFSVLATSSSGKKRSLCEIPESLKDWKLNVMSVSDFKLMRLRHTERDINRLKTAIKAIGVRNGK